MPIDNDDEVRLIMHNYGYFLLPRWEERQRGFN